MDLKLNRCLFSSSIIRNLVLVIERHHELGVNLQLASRPLHGGLKHVQVLSLFVHGDHDAQAK